MKIFFTLQISPIDIDLCQKTDILYQDFETFDLTHKSNDGCLRFFSNPNSKFWTHRPPLSDLRASKMTSVEISFFTSLIVEPYSTARPDWAYEFPGRTGRDIQICRTGPA